MKRRCKHTLSETMSCLIKKKKKLIFQQQLYGAWFLWGTAANKMYIYINYGDLFPNKRSVHKPHVWICLIRLISGSRRADKPATLVWLCYLKDYNLISLTWGPLEDTCLFDNLLCTANKQVNKRPVFSYATCSIISVINNALNTVTREIRVNVAYRWDELCRC